MAKDGVGKILLVTILLCLVCSIIVSTAAVKLGPLQEANVQSDLYKNILSVAGLYAPDQPIFEQFQKKVEMHILKINTAEFVQVQFEGQTSSDTAFTKLTNKQDIAKINKLPEYARVYLVRHEGRLDKVILPVYGYGLWSTLYGFLAIEADGNTVYGLKFYDQAETPGLGGEVDNIKWLKLWQGKKLYNAHGEPALSVIKGSVDVDNPSAPYQVDGLSGATITSLGVSHLIQFWLSEMGYRKFLDKIKAGELA